METLELQSQNIKCMGCVNNINKGLLELDGIDEVNVELESGKISIHGTQLSKTAIAEKLAILGYPVVE